MINNEPTNYFGTSFIKALEMHNPSALPFTNVQSNNALETPHATTIVAVRYKDGVVMAGDRRATMGLTIANRDVEKVLQADDYSGIAFAGTAGLAIEMAKLFQVQLEHYEKMSNKPLTFEGKSNQLAQLVRANMSMAFQGLVVVPLFAGYDLDNNRGRVFSYDVVGGKYEEFNFNTTGSGSVHAQNWIKTKWNENLTEEECVKLCLSSLIAAADEDAGTGGVDLIRKIFPTAAVISKKGYKKYSQKDIEKLAMQLLGGPEQGGSPVSDVKVKKG